MVLSHIIWLRSAFRGDGLFSLADWARLRERLEHGQRLARIGDVRKLGRLLLALGIDGDLFEANVDGRLAAAVGADGGLDYELPLDVAEVGVGQLYNLAADDRLLDLAGGHDDLAELPFRLPGVAGAAKRRPRAKAHHRKSDDADTEHFERPVDIGADVAKV